jgi:hypothetical protein
MDARADTTDSEYEGLPAVIATEATGPLVGVIGVAVMREPSEATGTVRRIG